MRNNCLLGKKINNNSQLLSGQKMFTICIQIFFRAVMIELFVSVHSQSVVFL